MESADEQSLVAGLVQGNARVFGQVFEAFRPRVFSFLLRLSRRRETAEDLTQETFVRLAKASPTLAPDTRLGPYLFVVARNLFLSHRRWEMLDLSRIFLLGEEHDDAVTAHDARAQATLELRAVEAALGKLPMVHREVLVAVGVEGLDHDTCAEVLGLKPDALRQRLARARQALREELSRAEKRTRRTMPQGEAP